VTPDAVGPINQDEWVVGRVEELPPGSVTIVPLGKFGVGVFNVHGRYHALVNYCVHRGAPLCRGSVGGTAVATDAPYEIRWTRDGEIVRCPWHGWEYDIGTGRCLTVPSHRIRSYPVRVIDGVVVVEGLRPRSRLLNTGGHRGDHRAT
jgi:nitrite reductase (NADH) small subunit